MLRLAESAGLHDGLADRLSVGSANAGTKTMALITPTSPAWCHAHYAARLSVDDPVELGVDRFSVGHLR